jgi:hypothetical protein
MQNTELQGYSFAQQTISANRIGAQTNGPTYAFPFLGIAPDARAGGFGDAGVASTPDASTIFWNSAKTAFVNSHSGISFSTEPWLRAVIPYASLSTCSGYYKPDSVQAIAASLRYFATGGVTLLSYQKTRPTYKAFEYALDLSYSRKLIHTLSVGITGRYCFSNLSNGGKAFDGTIHPVRTLAADIALFYQSNELHLANKKYRLRLGIQVSNIGKGVFYTDSAHTDPLPSTLRLGASFSLALSQSHSVCMLADVIQSLVPGGSKPAICGGMEYGYLHALALRAGYYWESVVDGNRKYYTLGTGIRFKAAGFDFAYLIPTDERSPLQNTIKFTFSLKLGRG